MNARRPQPTHRQGGDRPRDREAALLIDELNAHLGSGADHLFDSVWRELAARNVQLVYRDAGNVYEWAKPSPVPLPDWLSGILAEAEQATRPPSF